MSDFWIQTFSTGSAHSITHDPCDVSRKRPMGFAPWPTKGETVTVTEKHVLVKVGAHSRKEALRIMRDRGLLTRAAA